MRFVDATAKKNEKGFAALEMVLSFTFILMPILILVVTFPTWSARQMAARTAAREGARAAALSDVNDDDNARRIAVDTAIQVATNHNIPREDFSVTVEPTGNISRDDTIRVTVTMKFPILVIPSYGDDPVVGTRPRSVTHTEKVDQYRSF